MWRAFVNWRVCLGSNYCFHNGTWDIYAQDWLCSIHYCSSNKSDRWPNYQEGCWGESTWAFLSWGANTLLIVKTFLPNFELSNLRCSLSLRGAYRPVFTISTQSMCQLPWDLWAGLVVSLVWWQSLACGVLVHNISREMKETITLIRMTEPSWTWSECFGCMFEQVCALFKGADLCLCYCCCLFNSGQVPSTAEKNFLSSVKGLDMYGVDPHPCKVSLV